MTRKTYSDSIATIYEPRGMSVINSRTITDLVNKRIGNVLDVAEAAIPAERFPAFRRIVLREFGSEGFGADVKHLVEASKATERIGSGRNDTCRKGGNHG
jgi:hypothetical protein